MNTVNNYIAQVRHLAERNWIKAVSIAEEGIKAFPNEPLLYAELGYLYIQKENHKGAIEYFTKALKYAPDNNEYIFNLGTTYLKLEKFEESIKAYDRAKSYVPEILFNKTYAYRMTDNTEKEFDCLKQMADNKYRKEEIYVSLLTHLFIKKDNKAFKKYLEIAESLNFESPGIMYIKGWCFLKKNNYLAAYIEFSKMDQRGFSLDIFGTRYYEAAKAISKNDQALEILNRIINDFPDHEEARSLRAEEYLERGQNPDSSGDLQFLYEADNMYYDKNVKLIGAQRKKIKRVLKHRKFNLEKKD